MHRSLCANAIEERIRAIPDFPQPGIVFRDITPLLGDGYVLRLAVDLLSAPFMEANISRVAAMEARGFIFGALIAGVLGAGFVPLRKPGKLPSNVRSISYELEYGSASLEMHCDAIEPSERVLLVDDLIATGGTAQAAYDLIEGAGGHVAGCAFLIELVAFNGRARLGRANVHSVLRY